MEAEGPGPALALCGQTSTFTFLPREARQEAGPEPCLAPGPRPSHFLPGPNCQQLLKGRGPPEGWRVGRSLRWGEGGREPRSLGREGPGLGFLPRPARACFLRSVEKVATMQAPGWGFQGQAGAWRQAGSSKAWGSFARGSPTGPPARPWS